jgi:hypothetical protein
MSSLHLARRWLLVLALSALSACGGGGGGSSPSSIEVSLNPTPVTASWLDRWVPEPLTITARLSAVPTGAVYAVVVMDQAVFVEESVSVSQIDASTFSMSITPVRGLAVGEYSGNLTLHLCKDAACASEYTLSGAVLPYTLTVRPTLAVTVTIDGALQTSGGVPYEATAYFPLAFDIGSGVTVELSSHAPVQWVTDTHEQNATITTLFSDSTTWRGTISGAPNATGLSIGAIPDDQNQTATQVDFFIH